MAWFDSLGIIFSAALFGGVGRYLCLIAKFYRMKFKKGPDNRIMTAGLAFLLAGLVLQSGFFAGLPVFIPAALICAGGITFSVFAFQLYRTMMSIG